ncbi:unnamed protein product [Cylindrotheca closterium]|uniref:Uncharacterized protein n=1 Tax=Cylindrotheca closterium TaxID=2856 RepID=A0AAD2FFZ3_9STRA|nr:unnamed protein product [Cylindrotheca closterium]
MSYREAIQLNNQATSLLESKRFDEAILVACAAMEVFQKQTPTAEKVSLCGNDFVDQCMLSRHRDCDCDSNTMDEEYTYEHGIVLPLNTMDGTVITPVLIFNCALSHHLAARHCNDHAICSQHFLNKAQRLYTLAYDQQDQDQNMIFQAVIVDNIGVIRKILGNEEEAQACFEHLTSMLMMMIYCTEDDSCLGENKYRQHVQGFFWMNILENQRSLAPAA